MKKLSPEQFVVAFYEVFKAMSGTLKEKYGENVDLVSLLHGGR